MGLIDVYKYLIGRSKEDRLRLLVVLMNRARSNRNTLKYGKFLLKLRNNFLTLSVGKHWNRLVRQMVESPSRETVES